MLLTISAFSTLGHVDPRLVTGWSRNAASDTNPSSTAPATSPAAEPASKVQPISLSASDAVLVVESPDIFSARGTEALRRVAERIEELPQVRRLLWMDRIPMLNIFGLSEPLLPKGTASAARFAAAKEKAMKHPLVAGQLLSDDGRTTLMLITFNDFYLFSDAAATSELRRAAEVAAHDFPDLEFRFRVTGRIPAVLSAIASHEANQWKYQLIGYGVIFMMTLILFRGLRAVIIVALAPALGVFWTTGIIRFFDYNNPLVDVILPILVSLVGLTDGVHLMVQIRKLRAAGMPRDEAAEEGLKQVGVACFLTSLTTAVGFGSLMMADSQWVQEFGWCSTIGVVLCFIAVVTVIPLASSSWLGNAVHVGHQHGLIDRHLDRIGGVISSVLVYRIPVAAFSVASTTVLLAVGLTLKPDQRETDGLPLQAESTQAMLHVDQSFGGLEFSSVEIGWNESIEPTSPEILRVIMQVDDVLLSEPLIGHPLSMRNLIDAQPGSGPPEERMSLLELLPPPLKRAFFQPERRQANISFRVQDLGIATYGPVFERIAAQLRKVEAEHPNFNLRLDGRAVWRWRNLYQIVVDLASSLGSASVIILVILTVVYRSVRLGLISIIPNLFPLALTAAYLVFAGYNLEIVMVCNFTVCLGIAVDDTIHFLTRFREERLHCDSDDEAIRRAFTGVGTALIMTTAVLVAGFSIVTLSDSRDHRIFATMGAITIAAALFCDLVFLPALLSLFGSSKRSKNSHL
ncbi:MAG: efflux RND transporter permease subunit [Aureliella sp.]